MQKFEDICMPASYPWVESLQVTASLPLPAFQVEDDLKRESELYENLKCFWVTIVINLLWME